MRIHQTLRQLRLRRLGNAALRALGYEIHKTSVFTVNGIRYEPDPCSVGWTPQGEMTAEGAIQMITQRGLRDLRILDMCCGIGIIGLSIFSRLESQSIVKEVAFADISIFNLHSLDRTVIMNNIDPAPGNRFRRWLSDGLNNIPRGERFDLIVSNPPHHLPTGHAADHMSPSSLGTYDSKWGFHQSFYAQCHDYLTPRGEVWFLENSRAAKDTDFLPFVEANPNLSYVGQIPEKLDSRFFWMITRMSN